MDNISTELLLYYFLLYDKSNRIIIIAAYNLLYVPNEAQVA